MKKIVLTALLVFLFAASSFALPEPQLQVKKMVDTILAVLQQPESGAAEKKDQISGLVQKYLDMQSMSRRALGVHWQDATEEQRQRFADLFVRVLEGTYLNRIEDYSDGTVTYLKQRVKDNKAIVDTVIISKELEIPVQYKMVYGDGAWQIFDIVIEGVSLTRNYRSSYGEIIRRNGYEGLLTLMAEKVQKMEASL